MKPWKLLPLVVVASLTACDRYKVLVNEGELVLFGTPYIYLKMKVQNDFAGGKTYYRIIERLTDIDKYADTKERDITNVYTLNHTNEKVEIDFELYRLLSKANELKETVPYFNPLVGSLSDKWKSALNPSRSSGLEPRVLTNEEIQSELDKINSSSLELERKDYKYYARRVGDAQIDLGAIAKGYALDYCLEYYINNTGITDDFLLNLGTSSMLLGYNTNNPSTNGHGGFNPDHGNYSIKIGDLDGVYIHCQNCYVSTSSVSEQGKEIDGVMYSHIVNPETGSVINNYDAVVVTTPKAFGYGALGDVLSTSLMMRSKEEIRTFDESNTDISVIAIKGGKIDYMSEAITLYNIDGQKIVTE